MNRTICLLIVSFILINLLGCAHPPVVESVQSGDYDMTCVELAMAITDAKRFKAEAKSKKGFTGGYNTPHKLDIKKAFLRCTCHLE